MRSLSHFAPAGFAALMLLAAPVALVSPAPVAAQTVASAADMAAAAAFITSLSDRAFGVLRDKSASKPAKLAQFRTMLRDNFALEDIGNRLIRRYRNQITPAQYAAYQSVFPDFVTNVYAARLFDYASAEVKVVRTLPRGTRGDVDVYTRITTGNSGNPIEAIWATRKNAAGKWQVTNLTVSGVNVALTQEADFSSYIQKNGLDALVEFLRTANTKNASVAGKAQ
jgi:phospholipid transport system substrate-binding protein